MGKLGIYLVANYPYEGDIFLEAVRACRDLGVDFLEVGFPFSDPVADGEVIERASLEVLKRDRLHRLHRGLSGRRGRYSRSGSTS